MPGQDSSWSRQPANVLLAQQKAQRQFKAAQKRRSARERRAAKSPPSYAQIHSADLKEGARQVPQEEV